MKIARKHIVQTIGQLYDTGKKTVLVHFKKYSLRATRARNGFSVKFIEWRRAK